MSREQQLIIKARQAWENILDDGAFVLYKRYPVELDIDGVRIDCKLYKKRSNGNLYMESNQMLVVAGVRPRCTLVFVVKKNSLEYLGFRTINNEEENN